MSLNFRQRHPKMLMFQLPSLLQLPLWTAAALPFVIVRYPLRIKNHFLTSLSRDLPTSSPNQSTTSTSTHSPTSPAQNYGQSTKYAPLASPTQHHTNLNPVHLHLVLDLRSLSLCHEIPPRQIRSHRPRQPQPSLLQHRDLVETNLRAQPAT